MADKKNKKKILSFEDLDVYMLARELSRKIGKLIRKLPPEEEYNLKGQMRRANLSMTNNIAEGYGRYHYQENIQFCRQSRGSMCELIDDFNECYDNSYIDEAYRDELKNDTFRVIKVLNGYVGSLKRLKSESVSGPAT